MTTPASVYETPLTALSGEPLDPELLRGRAALIVNVASKCGLTPQYEGLQRLYERYQERGLIVLGTPCDQFAGQEPGTAAEISTSCSDVYRVTFPLTEKLEVNGCNRHPLYALLTSLADDSGIAGDVQWSFEKFLVSPRGTYEVFLVSRIHEDWTRQRNTDAAVRDGLVETGRVITAAAGVMVAAALLIRCAGAR